MTGEIKSSQRSLRSSDGFTNEDRDKINKLLTALTKMTDSFNSLKQHVRKTHEIIIEQQKEINQLRANLNIKNYQNDALEQYGRRESIRIHNVTNDLGSDATDIVIDIANQIQALTPQDDEGNSLNINLTRADIHRCHFLGKDNQTNRKIICRFNSSAWQKRSKIMLNKRHINQVKKGRYGSVFVSEDLTSMRNGMMYYLKQNHASRFEKVHTRNGALKFLDTEDLDKQGNAKWKTAHDPDGLHKILGDALDIDTLNLGFRACSQVLKMSPLPEFPELPDDEDEDEEV